ncbi:dihydrodipicolinate synthase family protein [Aeromicrobium panaciterrae]|uniref:dihydrodipicolinate synthase family protein n=1 Tax=Aeromicrobium panaciterrae TaxID=363861 RepID=UPI0031D0ECAA
MTTLTSGTSLRVPHADGTVTTHTARARSYVFDLPFDGTAPVTRSVFAAAHVVANPFTDPADFGSPQSIDWDATLAFRRHVWGLGLGVADAMDTAQRGGGLGWRLARDLIRRSGAEAHSVGGSVAFGAMTDQLEPGQMHSLERIVDAYVEQVGWIGEAGGVPVLMASRHLALAASSSDDYLRVYGDVIRQSPVPVFLHWLGVTFDPSLKGYWGSDDLDIAADTFIALVEANQQKISGAKISLLDAKREVDLRRRLPSGVHMHTGDDFNYAELIAGDEYGHSDALLGAFDALAVPARAALARLDDGDTAGFHQILDPTVALSRHVFATPTSAYKTGIVLLAWLNGHQDHFRMVASAETWRSVPHLAETFVLADAAGALADPELATHRMRQFLEVAGVVQ